MFYLHISFASFSIWILISCLLSFINGQLDQCDDRRFSRCQQSILSKIQESQGFNGVSNVWQTDPRSKCSSIRQDLDCLLIYIPLCHGREISPSEFNSVDVIRRAKSYLDKECDTEGGWRSSSCYRRPDIHQCEIQFKYQFSTVVTSNSCKHFHSFRNCVVNIVRLTCHPQELQLMGTFLMDKAQDLSWSCPALVDHNPERVDDNHYPQQTNFQVQNQFVTPAESIHISNQANYGQQQLQQQQQNLGNPLSTNNGQSASIDRFGVVPGSDHCLARASYFVRSCEDTLIQRQRDAREGRSSYDVQRRICCALFFYRDCISRVVVDRCRDPSPIAVDLLMGSRKRDLSVTCREYSRDQCSASRNIKGSACLLFCFAFLILFFKLDS